MRLASSPDMVALVIDTAFDACTAAILVEEQYVAHAQSIIGRGHAEHLVPMLEHLLAEAGDAHSIDHILVSVGPGSFTGLRVGVSAARALGLAWGAQVIGVSTTWPLMLAALEHYQQPIVVAHFADNERVFTQSFTALAEPLGAASIMGDAALASHLDTLKALCIGTASQRFSPALSEISPYPEPRYMARAALMNPLPPQPVYLGSLYASPAVR